MLLQKFQSVEVCAKTVRQLVLSRTDEAKVGFTLEAELAEDGEDELRVFVADVDVHGAARRCGRSTARASSFILITSVNEVMFSSLFVCLLATLHKNFGTDFHEIFREGWQWANE